MQRLEISGAVRPIYGSLGVKRVRNFHIAKLKAGTHQKYALCKNVKLCIGFTDLTLVALLWLKRLIAGP